MGTPVIPPPGALRRVVVASTRFKPGAHPAAREIASWFEARGIEVGLALSGEGVREVADGADLIVGVGGDGTLLGLARQLSGLLVPTIGINIGKLGFLAEFTAQDLRTYLDDGEGLFQVVPRLMLRCRIGDREPQLALNDAVITQGPMTQILEVAMTVDGRHATRYRSDGVVISTPTGSTAYSLSLGGPLLDPGMQALAVTPIAPHALTNRPLVLEGRSVLGFRVLREAPSLSLILDGQELSPLARGDRVEVRRADAPFLLASRANRSFYDILRRKLHWAVAPTGVSGEPSAMARAREEGVGFSAVYLHGFASSPGSTKATYLVERLRRRGLPVEVPDLNEGDDGFRGLTVTRMLEQTRRAVDRVRRLAGFAETAPVVIIGSSLGAYVASLLAAEDRSVKGLVLLAPAFDFGARFVRGLPAEVRQRLEEGGCAEVFHFGTGRPEPVSRRLVDDAAAYPAFPDVRCPTILIHGRNDESVPVEVAEQFAKGRRNVRLLLVEDDHRLAGSLEAIDVAIETFVEALADGTA